jgi:medium-chain acyl-[acyl-carrier-protein] hydrolase
MMMLKAIANPWIALPKPNPRAHLRLFCFSYAGGGASVFYPWSQALPPSVELCPVQLPGRENRLNEPPYRGLRPLLHALAPSLQPYLDVPFAFFGHSLGALVGFELARRFRRQHLPTPVHLFVSGREAPQIRDLDPPIHALPEAAFIEKLRRYDGTPVALLENPDIMAVFLPTLRADFALSETYVYDDEAPLACPISAFGGLQDAEVSQADLTAWRHQTGGRFALRLFLGGHFFLREQQPALLQAVFQDLRESAAYDSDRISLG